MKFRHVYEYMTLDQFYGHTDREDRSPVKVGDEIAVPEFDLDATVVATVNTSANGDPFVRIKFGGGWHPDDKMGLIGTYLVTGNTQYGLKVFMGRDVTEPVRAIRIVRRHTKSAYAIKIA